MGDYASDVAELFKHLSIERFGVIGVSGGGAYACAVAYALQERVMACVLVCSVSPLNSEVIADIHANNRLVFNYIAPTFATLSRTPLCNLNVRPARLIVDLSLPVVSRVLDVQLKQIAILEGANPSDIASTYRTALQASIVDDLGFARPSTAMGAM